MSRLFTSTSEEKTITNERRSIMLTEQTLDKLYAMKLSGMADAFKEQLQQLVGAVL